MTPGRKKTKGFEVARWIEHHCRFTANEWVGRPFHLLAWQRRWLCDLFEVEPDTGLRRYRWALLGVPKKNGKTELAAALALYFLIGDGEPAPLVVCAAASDDQADLVFGAAKRMAEFSPTLRQVTERYEREILVPSLPGARLRRVSASVGTNDGLSAHAVVCDELHEWMGPKGRGVWTVLTNSTGARRQPMVLQITTAGFDQETVCGEQYTYGKRVAAGEIDDSRYSFTWYEASENADWRDAQTWEDANPSWGVTLPTAEEFFRDQLGKKRESEFRRYFLNQWVEAEEIWEVASLWDDLAGDAELDPALPIHVAIDVGLRRDSSAVAVAQLQGDRVVLRATVWENPYPPADERSLVWKIDVAEIENHLRELAERFPESARPDDGYGPAFYYDPHFFERSAQVLAGDGLLVIEYPQTDQRMIPVAQTFFEVVQQHRILHDGDATLRRHIRSVVAQEKTRGWRISKPKGSRRKIDAAVAAAIAVREAIAVAGDAGAEPLVVVV